MAEFCRQCATEYGMFNDFVGAVRDGYTVSVVCEGCGPTFVISDGSCVYEGCIKRHGQPSEVERFRLALTEIKNLLEIDSQADLTLTERAILIAVRAALSKQAITGDTNVKGNEAR